MIWPHFHPQDLMISRKQTLVSRLDLNNARERYEASRHHNTTTVKKKMKIKNLGKQKKLRKDVPYFLMTYLSYRSFEDAHIIYYSIFSCLPCTGSRPTALPWSPSAVLRSPGCWTRFDCRPLTGRFARGIPPPSCHMIWPADRWWPAAVSPWWWEGGEGEKRGVSISVVFNWVSGYMGIPTIITTNL